MPKPQSTLKRTAIISTKLLNKNKKKILLEIHGAAKSLVQQYVDLFWPFKHLLMKYAGTVFYDKIQSDLFTSRFKQIACKQAIDLLKPIQHKAEYIKYQISKLDKFKDHEKIAKLHKLIRSQSKPEVVNYTLSLNQNVLNVDLMSSKTKHKGWLTIKSIIKKHNWKLHIPFIKTRIFNKWNACGQISNFVHINEKGMIKCVFSLNKPKLKITGQTIGCDIGMNHVYTLSNGQFAPFDKFNRDHNYLTNKLKRCKKNGKNHQKTIEHKKQHVNWTINVMHLTSIKCLKLENLKNIPKKAFNANWCYRQILNKIQSRCEEQGIEIIYVSPKNTSRRCFNCGWVDIKNRNDKTDHEKFKCVKCLHEANADLNAAKNIKLLHSDIIIENQTSADKAFYWNP